MFKLKLLLVLAFAGFVAHAEIDDVETDMEDAMANSEAAKEGAAAAKRRADHERRERDKAKSAAADAAARAKSKERDAKQEISAAEQLIERDRAEANRLLGEKTAFENQIVKLEKQILAYKAKSEKQKQDKEIAQKMRDERRDQTATLIKQAQLLEEELRKTKDEERMAIQELEQAKKDEKDSQARLKKAQEENQKSIGKLKARVDDIRAQTSKAKETAAASESKMRDMRQSLNKMESDAQMAEADAGEAKRRAEESASRLKDLKQRNAGKAAEYKNRKTAAESSSTTSESQEANARVEMAGHQQENDRLEAATDSGKVGVKLEKKATPRVSRKLALSCSLLEKPNASAKVIGARRKGATLTTETATAGWAKVIVDAKSSGYVPLTCFEGRTPSMQ